MDNLTNAEVALLGLLAEKARHPYDIEKEVEQRSMREWTDLSMSSIYKLLRKLEEGGYVDAQIELSDENRARKIYNLTGPGTKVLKQKIQEILSEPEQTKWRIDIGISFLGVIDKELAINCLRLYRTALEDRIQGYGELEGYLKSMSCPVHTLGLARRPIRIWEGEIRWIDEYIEDLLRGGDEA